MKYLIMLLAITTSFSAFSATEISTCLDDSESSVCIPFFHVSSFNSKMKHCYVGELDGVCEKVKKGEKIGKDRYLSGSHDYFQVVSCKTNLDSVSVQTKLFDDYGTDGDLMSVDLKKCN